MVKKCFISHKLFYRLTDQHTQHHTSPKHLKMCPNQKKSGFFGFFQILGATWLKNTVLAINSLGNILFKSKWFSINRTTLTKSYVGQNLKMCPNKKIRLILRFSEILGVLYKYLFGLKIFAKYFSYVTQNLKMCPYTKS